jgi:hypothetical protein
MKALLGKLGIREIALWSGVLKISNQKYKRMSFGQVMKVIRLPWNTGDLTV